MKIHYRSLLRLVLSSIFLLSACSTVAPNLDTVSPPSASIPSAVPASTLTASDGPYWPTQDWRTSAPEQQGIDSELLAKMMEEINAKQINIHSVIIVRHGSIVEETYFQPSGVYRAVQVHSITKSIVSALVGIAIEQGSIDNVNHKVLDYFPDLKLADNDARKQAITIEHLLTMSSGLEWSDDVNLGEISSSPDWVKYVLDRPMKAAPGEQFNYNTGAITILSAILNKTTGQSPLEFANAKLFGPLGISGVYWETTPTGLEQGGDGIQMVSRDLAKFGYLYLRNGVWNGKQIVPASWVKTSLEKHIDPHMQNEMRAGYGYLWWVQTFGASAAQGYGGQYILLMPDKDLDVVFTSDLKPEDFNIPAGLFENYILPAIKSNDPLPANPTSAARLEALCKAASQP